MTAENNKEEEIDEVENTSTESNDEVEETSNAPEEKKEEAPSSSGPSILWCGVSRDDVVLAQHLSDKKAENIAGTLLKAPPNTGWDFSSYDDEGLQGCKFHIYQRIPFEVGQRVKVRGLVDHTFLNGQSVRILEYRPEPDKYVCKPCIPLSEQEDLFKSRLVFKSENIAGKRSKEFIVWTLACVYDGSNISQASVCTFLQKLAVLGEAFKEDWVTAYKMQAQEVFGAMMQAQIELYDAVGKDAFDPSLAYAKRVISKNVDLHSQGSF